jgi:hypothetical protein
VNNDHNDDDYGWWEITVMVREIYYEKRLPPVCDLFGKGISFREAKKACQHLKQESHTSECTRNNNLEHESSEY